MKLVKIILGSVALAGAVIVPTQVAASETTTNNTGTIVEDLGVVSAANTQKISEIFPDPIVASRVASFLGVAVDTVPTTEKLETIESLRIADGAKDLTGLDTLPNLSKVSLVFTDVSDIEILARIPKLEHLTMYSNENIVSYDVVEKLVGLDVLILSSETLTELPVLDKLVVLDSLWIDAPLVTDYSTVTTVKTITELSINDAKDNLTTIDFLEKLPNLVDLDLAGNAIADITVLEKLQNIQFLALDDNKITSIASVAKLPNLKMFSASSNLITDLSPLAGLTELHDVYMPRNSVEDISPLAQVRTINLEEQIIFYEAVFPGANAYVENVVKGLDGQLITPALISDNGYYDNGNLNFEGLTNASRPAYTFNIGEAQEIPLPDLSGLETISEQAFGETLEVTPSANETLAFSGIVAYFFTPEAGTPEPAPETPAPGTPAPETPAPGTPAPGTPDPVTPVTPDPATPAPVITTPTPTPTTGTTLPNTGQNDVEKVVLGGSATILGALALILKRKK